MKIEKDGIVKELEDEFMLADYIQAGWKLAEEKASKLLKSEKEDK